MTIKSSSTYSLYLFPLAFLLLLRPTNTHHLDSLSISNQTYSPHATSQHHGPPSKLTSHQNNHLNHHQPTKTSINHQKNFITIKTYATIKDHDRDPSQPPSFHLTPTIDHHPPKTSQSHDHQLPEPLFKKNDHPNFQSFLAPLRLPQFGVILDPHLITCIISKFKSKELSKSRKIMRLIRGEIF